MKITMNFLGNIIKTAREKKVLQFYELKELLRFFSENNWKSRFYFVNLKISFICLWSSKPLNYFQTFMSISWKIADGKLFYFKNCHIKIVTIVTKFSLLYTSNSNQTVKCLICQRCCFFFQTKVRLAARFRNFFDLIEICSTSNNWWLKSGL